MICPPDNNSSSDNTARSTSATPEEKPRPRKKRRRWPWIVGGVFLLLLLLIALIPTLVSTDAGTGWVSSMASDTVKGRIEMGDLEVSWFSPVRVADLRIYDLESRQALHVKSVTTEKGLFKTLTGYKRFKTVTVDSPDVVLYQTPEGGYSLMQALEPTKPTEEPSKPPVDLTGAVKLNAGRIRIVQTDGRELTIDKVEGSADIDTLNKIASTLTLSIRDAGDLAIGADIENFVTDGRIDPKNATIAVKVNSEKPLEVRPLAAFGLGRPMQGTLAIDIDGTWADGKANGTVALTGRGIGETDGAIQPMDLELTANVTTDADTIDGKFNLASDAANLKGDFNWADYTAGVSMPETEKLLPLLMDGGELTLPDIRLALEGRVDLPRLARAVPQAMTLREGIELTAGEAAIDLAVLGRPEGDANPGAQGTIDIKDVKARREGRSIDLEPVKLAFDTGYDRERGLVVRNLSFDAAGTTVTGSGELEKLTGKIDSNLAALHRQVSEIVDTGEMTVAGTVKGTFGLSRPEEGAIDQTVDITVTDLRYRASRDAEPIALSTVSLDQKGRLVMPGNILRRYTLERADVTVADKLRLTNTGFIVLADRPNDPGGKLRIETSIPGADVAALRDLASLAGLDDLPKATGRLTLTNTVDRASKDAPIVIGGRMTLADPSIDGTRLGGDLSGRWSEVRMKADNTVSVGAFELTGPPANVSVNGLALSTDPMTVSKGTVKLRADLASVSTLLKAMRPEGRAPSMEGSLTLNADVKQAKATEPIVFDGNLALKDVTIDRRPLGGDIEGRWTNVAIAPKEKTVAVPSFKLTGPVARVEIDDLKVTMSGAVDLKGRYEINADLARVADLARAFLGEKSLPQLGGNLTWTGQGESDGRKGTRFTGSATVDNFKVGGGWGAYTEEKVTLSHAIGFDPKEAAMNVDSFKLNSKPLVLTLSGRATDLDKTMTLDLTGRYEASWEEITRLMHEFAPETKGKVDLKGRRASDIVVKGPLNKPDVKPAWRDLVVRAGAGWDSGNLYGMKVGKADFAPRLEGGKVTIPQSDIPASGGTLRLAGEVDLTEPAPVYRLKQRLAMIDKVNVTPEMSQELLSRINPLLGSVVAADGTVDLGVQNLVVPTGKEVYNLAAGKGRLSLDMNVKPAGPLSLLITKLMGAPGDGGRRIKLDVNEQPFNLGKGGVSYRDFSLDMGGGVTLLFGGSVPLDDTKELDISMSAPVTEHLLTQFGVAETDGKMPAWAEAMKGKRITFYIRGTRTNPRLDLAGSLADLGKTVAKELLRQRARQGIRDLLNGDKKENDKPDDGAEKPQDGGGRKPDDREKPGDRKKPDDKKRPGLFEGILREALEDKEEEE